MSVSETSITLEGIQRAYNRIQPFIHQTPILTCSTMNSLTTNEKKLYFKAEFLQKTGSFKARGAINSVLLAKESGLYQGIATHSSGNHAQALAWATKSVGSLQAHIVMPRNCPKIKRDAVTAYGATIYTSESTQKAREEMSAQVSKDTDSLFIHPSENFDVICGQGTIAIELLLHQVPELDCIIVPVGGGGLISGITTAAKAIKPSILIIGAEPTAANDAMRSKHTNTLIKHEATPITIADGLRTSLGTNTWPIVRDNVDDVLSVSEDDILRALSLVWYRMKYLIEPSAAVSVAVAISEEFGKKFPTVHNIGVILCGGNVDIVEVAEILRKANIV